MSIRRDLSGSLAGGRRALLINPPIYDTQYWARWSQPHGLLKVATWLRSERYEELRLLDCLATDKNRRVPFRVRGAVKRDDITRRFYEFGWPLGKLQTELERHAAGELFRPDEIWITSIMTYWWESTRDVIRLVNEVFDTPKPTIYVGGIYPTLIPEHADARLSEDTDVVVVPGEVCDEAANAWTDLSLYRDPIYEATPCYAIITGSRGCPFNCGYCAQLKLNDGNRRVRSRTPRDVADEIEQKQKDFGIREVAFYEDNLLLHRENFLARMEEIEKRGLGLEIYAPEGMEPRLLEHDLLTRMRRAGFRRIHLALETIDNNIARGWNRRQASIEKFDRAVAVAQECGYRVGAQDLNAFVIFGLPDEDLQAVVDTALYASHRVGSVVPMLFTPVPGSIMYEEHKEYLLEEQKWDLHDLNGKLLPFLEYNRERRLPGIRASDYLELEGFMMQLNSSKVYQKRFDVAGSSQVARAFRSAVV